MRKRDYEKDLRITGDLKEEWKKQASLYSYFAKEYAKADKKKDLMKEKLDIIKAELDLEIRTNPKKFIEIPKITEAVVSSLILLQSEYKNAKQEFLDTENEALILNLGVKAFEHKKKALENLVQLCLSERWSEPKEPSMIRSKQRRNN